MANEGSGRVRKNSLLGPTYIAVGKLIVSSVDNADKDDNDISDVFNDPDYACRFADGRRRPFLTRSFSYSVLIAGRAGGRGYPRRT